MKRFVSIFCMMTTALVMIFMNSLPHHHHCMGILGVSGPGYVCMADDQHEASCCAKHQEESSPCQDAEGESTCSLHHINLLIERVMTLNVLQIPSVFINTAPAVEDYSKISENHEFFRPPSETAISILLTRDKALRAPPVVS